MGKEFNIVKLSGSDNYHVWKFAVQNLIDYEGLTEALAPASTLTPNVAKMEDGVKLAKAKGLLALSVETSVYAHISSATSALEIWNILKSLYEDRGLSRRITLLRELISIRLEESESMNDYISKIKSTSNKLIGIGFNLSTEWLGAIMLAGLTEDFRPLIMGIETNNEAITSDLITSKLLDMQTSGSSDASAFFSKNKKKKNHKRKCFSCGSKFHLSNACDKKSDKVDKSNNDKKDDKKDGSKKKAAFIALMCNNVENSAEAADSEWYIDSGAGCHMARSDNGMRNSKPSDVNNIMSANNGKMIVEKCGDVSIELDNTSIAVDNVLHVPDIAANLLSVHKMCQKNNTVVFDRNGCTVFDAKGEVIFFVKPTNGIYKIGKKASNVCLLAGAKRETALTWHRRLGHMNLQTMKRMQSHIAGVNFSSDEHLVRACVICASAKSTRLPFQTSETKTQQILELIHTDIMGPMETASISGKRYCLTFIDDFSRKVWVRFLKRKDETFNEFKAFRVMIEKQTGSQIKIIRSDNGGEYTSEAFEKYCQNSGIRHQRTAPYTPEQNGVSERMNRTLKEKAKCMLFDAQLPKLYWAEAVHMAAYIVNRSINSVLKDKTPDEVFYDTKIDISDLKIFGSNVMVHVPKQRRRKWDVNASQMIFVGYDSDTKGYRCIDRETHKLTISRDVRFYENMANTLDVEHDTDEESETIVDNNDVSAVDDHNESFESAVDADTTLAESVSDDVNKCSVNETVRETSPMETDNVRDDPNFQTRANIEPLGTPRSQSRSRRPIDRFQVTWMAFLAEPVTVEQAINGQDANNWKRAMDEEINSHGVNNTWSLTELPQGRKAIKSRWVFKLKENSNEKRFKARLVAKGFSQKFGIDYDETFSPVVRTTTLRIMFGLAAQLNLKIHQMDAITAFLQSDLNETIYMQQPVGYEDGTNRVCKLNKAIYGLKQAGRQWNLKLSDALVNFGLLKSNLDPCVFFGKEKMLVIAVYVDDMLIFYRSRDNLDEIKKYLNEKFHMKDIGHATECIGLKINQFSEKIEVDQTKYIEEVIRRFNQVDEKVAKTPSDPNVKLSIKMVDEQNEITGRVPYQEAVGSLLYIAQGTRPDIAFAVNDVSRFNSKHCEQHWNAVLRIIRYLKGTKNQKLCYQKDSEKCDLHGFSDADWASDIDKRRSCTGFVFRLCGAAISWKSQRQSIVALSSTEAEYIALSSTVKECLWIQQFVNELKPLFVSTTIIYADNSSSIKIGEMEAFRERTKHIDVRYHHIRQQIAEKRIELRYVSTHDNTADLLTKPLTGEKTSKFAAEMGLQKQLD